MFHEKKKRRQIDLWSEYIQVLVGQFVKNFSISYYGFLLTSINIELQRSIED